jgi:ABC-type sugar transport system ATPase subunit
MNNIVFDKVCKNYGRVEVIKNLDLEIEEGKRLILLGPSGCGKTTILRMIAGLEGITSGNLYMGGKLVNNIDPGERNVAMVFQNYALYPHMTVETNILFGLQVAKASKDVQQERLKWALEILGLTEYRERYPRELSGGQRQRVALCRALVKKAPYFLLDEPLSNLDAQLRTLARAELVKVHETYNPTFVYVTHDQIEAMTIGQKIVVLNSSAIQQYDVPSNIYNRPKNVFVARFIGSPNMNIVECQVDGDEMVMDGQRVKIRSDWREKIGDRKKIKFGIRPENIIMKNGGGDCRMNVTYVENHGSKLCIAFTLCGAICMATADVRTPITGDTYMVIDWEKAHFFDADSSENVGYPEGIRNDMQLPGSFIQPAEK